MPRVTITVPDQNPQPYRFQLDREVVTIGRGGENDIAISCGSVSVRHAEMHRVSRGYELRDLGSTNGSKLDGEPKTLIILRNGQSIMLGDVYFDFYLSDEELEILSKEPERLPPLRGNDDQAVQEDKELGPAATCEDHHEVPVRATKMAPILLLILILAAFVGGMAVRYQKDTGNNWLHDILGKSAAKLPAAPASGVK